MKRAFGCSVFLLASALASGCASSDREATTSNVDRETRAAEKLVDARAEAYLEKMCEFLADQQTLRFNAEIDFDDYLAGDRKIQKSRWMALEMRRPNRARGVSFSEDQTRRYWYDGVTLAIYDEDANVYSRVDVPDNYDAMIADVQKRYGFSMNLGELIANDSCAIFKARLTSAAYIGERYVGDHLCHHLAFEQENVDWQVWVDAGEQPWPRKFVVTYKLLPASPQYVATFTTWDTNITAAEGDFVFTPPESAERVEMVMPTAAIGRQGGNK